MTAPCVCLCQIVHKAERICTGTADTIVIILGSSLRWVEIPMCFACAEARERHLLRPMTVPSTTEPLEGPPQDP